MIMKPITKYYCEVVKDASMTNYKLAHIRPNKIIRKAIVDMTKMNVI